MRAERGRENRHIATGNRFEGAAPLSLALCQLLATERENLGEGGLGLGGWDMAWVSINGDVKLSF